MSEFLWKRLGRDPGIIGRPFKLERATMTIAGVAPASFTGMNWLWRADVWYPFTASAKLDGRPEIPSTRTDRGLLLLGRLEPNVSADQARVELAGLFAGLATTYPDTDKDRKPLLEPISALIPEDRAWIASSLAALVDLALLTLTAAGSNATDLLLGLTLSPLRDGPGVSFAIGTVAAVLVAGLCIGLAPAWRAASDGLSGALKRELATTGTRRHRPRSILVVVQTTVATAVLVGVGASWRSTSNLRQADLGCAARNLLAAETSRWPSPLLRRGRGRR